MPKYIVIGQKSLVFSETQLPKPAGKSSRKKPWALDMLTVYFKESFL